MDEMIVALDKALRLQKITYVVIGGIAASLHGRPLMTMDSDIVIVLEEIKVPASKLDSRYMRSAATVLSDETGKKEILENLFTVFRWMKKKTLS